MKNGIFMTGGNAINSGLPASCYIQYVLFSGSLGPHTQNYITQKFDQSKDQSNISLIGRMRQIMLALYI